MEQQIKQISFAAIHQITPILKNMGNVLLMTDETDTSPVQPDNTFSYPFRLDGIVLLLQGNNEIRVNVNLNEYTITEGSLLTCMPGDILQFIGASDTETPPRVMLISPTLLEEMRIDVSRFAQVLPVRSMSPVIKLDDDERKELCAIYAMLRQEIDHDHYFHRDIIHHLIAAYLYKIASMMVRHKEREGAANGARRHKREQVILQDFIRLVSEHHRSERSLEFYADKLFISPKYLSTIIRRNSERTAKEWIDDYVILEIKHLLRYSNMSVQEISNALNFPNQSFLGKFFKKHTGMSPGTYKTSAV